MSEMKTASEWFKELPRAIEKKAIEAKLLHPKAPHTQTYGKLCKAINNAFDWDATSDGRAYWQEVYLGLTKEDPKFFRKRIAKRLPKGQHEYTVAIQLRTVYIEGIRAVNVFVAKDLAKKALFDQTGITEDHISTLHGIKTK